MGGWSGRSLMLGFGWLGVSRGEGVGFGFVWARLCAGIRDALARFTRCPCAGRHLLFFAAAKKSRQEEPTRTPLTSTHAAGPQAPHTSHNKSPGWCPLPTLRTGASPASITRTRANGSEWYAPPS